MTAVTQESDWNAIEAKVRDIVRKAHSEVEFDNIWVRPAKSWCDMDMVEVWAIYDGQVDDLAPPSSPRLEVLIQDMLWDSGIDAWPAAHLVAKSDAKDWRPEGV